MKRGRRAVVIGAGLGGLAAACRLARDGWSVTVLERTGAPGGKCSEVRAAGYRFDTGPSLVTMRFVLDELFSYCGTSTAHYLDLIPVEPTCRYRFPDQAEPLDLYRRGDSRTILSDNAARELESFLAHSQDLWQRTADAFVFNPLAGLADLRGLRWADLLKINAFSTLAPDVDRRLSDPALRLIFKRFATYNGSDPWKTPATMNVIPHVELDLGAWYPRGGLYRIPMALYSLAQSLGVTFHFDTTATSLKTSGTSVASVQCEGGGSFACDLLVSNTDAAWFYRHLHPAGSGPMLNRVYARQEPSCSGFIILAGMPMTFPALSHHTIFFSPDYRQEFRDIFDAGIPAANPTVYIANTSRADPGDAPEGSSNLFILVNAPATGPAFQWTGEAAARYVKTIGSALQRHGTGIDLQKADYLQVITPQDLEDRYLTNRGSIYGYSSNSPWSAFLRPRNRAAGLNNVFLTGGSTHPGGGIPLVLTSARHAHTLIQRQFL